jgi:hypothetical protein
MMKNKFLGLAIIPCLVLVFGVIALAVGQVPISQQKIPNPSPILTADLQINWIAASPCGCDPDAAAVDALILQGPVTVRVSNASSRAVDAKVTVDAMKHRFGAVSSYQNIHLDKNQSLNVVFFPNLSPQNPLLICRSLGIKAEITLTAGAALDPNLSNNTLTIHGCQPIVD